MRKVLILFLLLYISGKLCSQNLFGKVEDVQAQPIAYATVVLLHASDSSFVKGVTCGADGVFRMDGFVKDGILKVSALGYKTVFENVHGDKPIVVKMQDEAQKIREIVVKGSRPFYQVKDGNLLMNVEGTVLAGSQDVTEVLLHVPGIVTTANGNWEVFGKGQPIIYINKRKVQNIAEVKHLSPTEIKSVELITNPGAKYDAAGMSVLQILTVRKKNGWQCQLGETLKQNDLFSHSSDVKMGIKRGKFSLSADYTYDQDRMKFYQPNLKELDIDGISYVYDGMDEKGKSNGHGSNWQISCDYEINEKQALGIEWDASSNKLTEYRFTGLDYLKSHDLIKHIDVNNSYTNRVYYNHVNAFYNVSFSKILNLDVNLDYVYNHNRYNQNTIEKSNVEDANTTNKGVGTIEIYSGKASLEYIPNKIFQLTGGVDIYSLKNNSCLFSSVSNALASDYMNKETKSAIFLDAKLAFGGWNFSGGLRYELVPSHYIDKIVDTKTRKTKEQHVFPSFCVAYRKGEWASSLALVSKITRPTFRQLSNSSYYGNEFMYQQGNPLLKSAMSYMLSWNVGYKFVNVNASYDYVHNYITTDFYMQKTDKNRIVSSFTNYDKISYLRLNVSAQKKIAWWNPSLVIGVEKPFFTAEYMGESLKYDRLKFFFVANQYIELPKSYMLSVYYYYCNGGLKDAVKIEPYQMLNVGLRKTFFEKRLSVYIDANDIFHTMKFKEEEKIRNLVFRQTEDYSRWNYSISLKYYISPVKQKYRGKNSVQDEIRRL